LLVGKTSTDNTTNGFVLDANGTLNVVRSSEYLMRLNRTTTDGEILRFQKDGASVGSIGAHSTQIYVGTGDTGLYFNAGNDSIDPYNTSTPIARSDAISLGAASRKFKDAHFSGTVNANAFVGDGSGLTNVGGGAWTFINATTVTSSVASIDITGMDSTYDMYVLQLVKVAPVNTGSGNTFRMATSSNGGSTFDTSGYSFSAGSVTDAITSFGFQSSASNSHIRLTDTGSGSTSGESLSGFIYLVKPSEAANFYCFWDLAGLSYPSSQFQRHIGGAQRETAADVDAIRIYHGNNIDGGTIRLFGIKNS